jgi:hypothetical protein
MSGRFLIGAVLMLSLTQSISAKTLSDADLLRQQAEHLCYDDVQKLCSDSIPDEDRVKACMASHRKQLSFGCLKVFDQGTAAK